MAFETDTILTKFSLLFIGLIAVVTIFVSFTQTQKSLTKVERQLSLTFSKNLIAKGLQQLLSQFMDT